MAEPSGRTPLRRYAVHPSTRNAWAFRRLFPYTVMDVTDPQVPKPVAATASRAIAECLIKALHARRPTAPHQEKLFEADPQETTPDDPCPGGA